MDRGNTVLNSTYARYLFMKFGYIYIIRNVVNTKNYIGQTTKKIINRWHEHLYNYNKRDQAIYYAMRKYGIKNFQIEEIERVPFSDLDDREIFWIKKFNTLLPNGYNMTKGGNFGRSNPMFIPEIAQKVSLHFIGDKNPAKRPEVREKIRKSAIGRSHSSETKKKMSDNPNRKYWAGKTLSDETKSKISKNHGCRGKFGYLNPNSKKVARLDKTSLEVIAIYDSFKDAEKWAKENVKSSAHYSNISRCCNGKQVTAFGYKWKYVEEV